MKNYLTKIFDRSPFHSLALKFLRRLQSSNHGSQQFCMYVLESAVVGWIRQRRSLLHHGTLAATKYAFYVIIMQRDLRRVTLSVCF